MRLALFHGVLCLLREGLDSMAFPPFRRQCNNSLLFRLLFLTFLVLVLGW